jgi:hypothetical protein
MSEPLHEGQEVAWLVFLDRFEQVIYPLLFEKRGYSRGEALIIWTLQQQTESIEELKEEMRS